MLIVAWVLMAISVLQIGPVPPPYGGVQSNMMAIRKHLRERGHRAGMVNITRHRAQEGDEIWFPRSPMELIRLMYTLPYDILHLHVGGDFTPRLVALCLILTAVPGRKSVLTFHSGGYPSSPEGKAAAPFTLRGMVVRRLDRIVCVNQQMVDMFRRYGVSQDRLRLILPFALPSEVPSGPMPEPLASFFENHSPVLLTVGLLEPEYDLGRQMDALGSLREKFPRAGLAIVGSGALEAELKGRRAGKPYGEHILMCGDTPHADVLRAIHAADLMWRTTLYDGDAISVREALHLGTPVIATDNGMRPEGTMIVPVGDTAALLEATAKGLKAGRRPGGISNGAVSSNMEQMLELYRSLVKD